LEEGSEEGVEGEEEMAAGQEGGEPGEAQSHARVEGGAEMGRPQARVGARAKEEEGEGFVAMRCRGLLPEEEGEPGEDATNDEELGQARGGSRDVEGGGRKGGSVEVEGCSGGA
jgi:hypothetical protein